MSESKPILPIKCIYYFSDGQAVFIPYNCSLRKKILPQIAFLRQINWSSNLSAILAMIMCNYMLNHFNWLWLWNLFYNPFLNLKRLAENIIAMWAPINKMFFYFCRLR